jgi:hypothetical protein
MEDIEMKLDERLEVVKETLIKDIVKNLKDRNVIQTQKAGGKAGKQGSFISDISPSKMSRNSSK